MLRRRHQQALDRLRIPDSDVRMAQVRTKAVKGHNKYVYAEDCQQVHLVAEQEHKACDRDALNKRTSRCEDQPFDRVGACHGQRG